ncbi:LexA family protein [Streptomyces sp. NPDC020192]|uniref:LexA family protein n=1 Tax=Streptomyces sp. NPDC020192 TaxID=3365066 RepID=UPI003799E271
MHRVEHLTDTQERVLRCIRQAIADRGEAPTMQEIGEAAGMRSRASVHYRLVEPETKQAIVREPGRARGIRLAWPARVATT